MASSRPSTPASSAGPSRPRSPGASPSAKQPRVGASPKAPVVITLDDTIVLDSSSDSVVALDTTSESVAATSVASSAMSYGDAMRELCGLCIGDLDALIPADLLSDMTTREKQQFRQTMVHYHVSKKAPWTPDCSRCANRVANLLAELDRDGSRMRLKARNAIRVAVHEGVDHWSALLGREHGQGRLGDDLGGSDSDSHATNSDIECVMKMGPRAVAKWERDMENAMVRSALGDLERDVRRMVDEMHKPKH
jgi:hypothetical protein